MHVCMSASSKCDFVLLELLTLVASKNTTLPFSTQVLPKLNAEG